MDLSSTDSLISQLSHHADPWNFIFLGKIVMPEHVDTFALVTRGNT